MNVGQLKRFLNDYNDDAEVVLAQSSGDYWDSVIVKKTRDVDANIVVWSEYHTSYRLPADDKSVSDYDNNENHPNKQVVIIS